MQLLPQALDAVQNDNNEGLKGKKKGTRKRRTQWMLEYHLIV